MAFLEGAPQESRSALGIRDLLSCDLLFQTLLPYVPIPGCDKIGWKHVVRAIRSNLPMNWDNMGLASPEYMRWTYPSISCVHNYLQKSLQHHHEASMLSDSCLRCTSARGSISCNDIWRQVALTCVVEEDPERHHH